MHITLIDSFFFFTIIFQHQNKNDIIMFSCFLCKRIFERRIDLLTHYDEEHASGTQYRVTSSALNGSYEVHSRDINTTSYTADETFELLCSEDLFQEFDSVLKQFLLEHGAGKCALNVVGLFRRLNNPESLPTEFPMRTTNELVTMKTNRVELYHYFLQLVNERIGKCKRTYICSFCIVIHACLDLHRFRSNSNVANKLEHGTNIGLSDCIDTNQPNVFVWTFHSAKFNPSTYIHLRLGPSCPFLKILYFFLL